LPPLVERAVRAARDHDFPFSCRPEQGRLLQALAGGAHRRIAETGTGCGVGLAWLASGAAPGVRLLSAERDAERARIAATVFEDCEQVTILHGDWRLIEAHGPFDLLVLDGGGQAKGNGVADPEDLLVPGGTVVIDDFTPATSWPPRFNGVPDRPRIHWLTHPQLRAVEVRIAPDLSAVVGTRVFSPAADGPVAGGNRHLHPQSLGF
jgi:predicted O-methyltransferase YrrM